MKKHKILFFIFFLNILSSPFVHAQIINISGNFQFEDDASEVLYDIIAFRCDSSIYEGNIFVENEFSFTINLDSISYIRFSSLGYDPLYYMKDEIMSLAVNNIAKIGMVRLKTNLILDEIIIEGRKKTLGLSSTGYSVNIKDTYLSKYGTFEDVIMRIPGILFSPRKEIGVIGKSNVLFVLNGRRLNSTSELEILNPQNIKTIYIDHEPGSEYEASYDAVVRVETDDSFQDYYYIDLKNEFEVSRVLNDNFRSITESKRGKIIYGLSVEYSTDDGYKQYDTEYKKVWVNTDSIISNRNATLKGKFHNLLLIPSIKWDINKFHKFEVVYKYNNKDGNSDATQNFSLIRLDDKEDIETYKDLDENRSYHNPSLYHIWKQKSNTLNVSVEYYASKNKKIQDAKEIYKDGKIQYELQDFDDKYQIWASAADYTRDFDNWKLKAGGKISGIKDEGYYLISKESMVNNSLNDKTYALYTDVSGNISRFTFTTAIRSEWDLMNYQSSSYQESIKSDYLNLFPSASIKYISNNALSLSLSYRKSIIRPSYNQINPNKTYIDPLSYMVGNPLLKSTLTDALTFSMEYSSLYFSSGYNVDHNVRAQITEINPDNKIIHTYANIPQIKKINFLLVHSFNNKWIKSNLSLRTQLQDIRLKNRVYSKFNDIPAITGRVNVDFALWKNGGLNIYGLYYNDQFYNITERKSSGYISFGINHSFLCNKLNLNTGIADAFKLYKPNTWEQVDSNSYIKMNTDAGTRYFYITLQYRFGKMKSSQNSQSITSDEKRRL
ncbi:hypothetical protein Barb7_01831 [Bacteroidales bacterium Barb7]|nr:hypothetical protein Barb7_01831 [Bacteroidales bacterium Barb7]